jgi:hypothetical protein
VGVMRVDDGKGIDKGVVVGMLLLCGMVGVDCGSDFEG